jgi:flagellar hook-associated protein 3 FlgL
MRLSTSNQFDASITNLQQRQQKMQQAQQQLTSGKRIAAGSDDPAGAGRAERAMVTIGRIDANQRALEASRNSMTLTEAALGGADELLQQVRETMVIAGNATYSDAERVILANKIAGLRDQMLTIANRSDGGNGFLFSGQGSSNPPFLDQNGGVGFVGVPGAIASGNDDFPLTVDGLATWEQARSGNGSFETSAVGNAISGAPAAGWIDAGRVSDPAALTGHNYQIQVNGTAPAQTYSVTDLDLVPSAVVASSGFTPGKSITVDGMSMTIAGAPVDGDRFAIKPATSTLKVFDVLDRAVAELRTPLRGSAEIAQSVSNNLRDLDAVMSNLQNVRGQVGERMNNLDGTESRMAAQKLYNQSERSAAEDLDMVQGISDFQNQQTGYDAALKTYAMVQRMSLFQYINV